MPSLIYGKKRTAQSGHHDIVLLDGFGVSINEFREVCFDLLAIIALIYD